MSERRPLWPLSLLDSKGTRLDQQAFPWKELVPKPISKLDDDYYGCVQHWELLIKLAEDMGQDDMAEEFRTALVQGQEHLARITQWHNQCVRSDLI